MALTSSTKPLRTDSAQPTARPLLGKTHRVHKPSYQPLRRGVARVVRKPQAISSSEGRALSSLDDYEDDVAMHEREQQEKLATQLLVSSRRELEEQRRAADRAKAAAERAERERRARERFGSKKIAVNFSKKDKEAKEAALKEMFVGALDVKEHRAQQRKLVRTKKSPTGNVFRTQVRRG